ncbi:MAG: anaerobic ribonucleoside-triphosphate reductase activating protein [Eubacterium sp.]|nr:anaerobic ribonucleoside-triphosphate reductase activating protein [Eubacterium sp.]
MECNLRINDIIEDSIVDGPGLRFTIFVQGCPHNCRGCHNPQTHAFDGGRLITVDELFDRYRKNPLLSGVTFSGGEPFCQPEALARLGQMVRKEGGNVITYTGFIYEDLLDRASSDPWVKALLDVTDLLIDGPYIEEQRSLELPFRGSANQRLIRLTDEFSGEII